MYENTLKQLDLSPEQAKLYSLLLHHGPLIARKIVLLSGFKRGLAYKTLDQLLTLDLIEKQEQNGKVAIFQPKHPATLLKILDQKKQQLAVVSESVKSALGQMTSDFNLISGKPSIQFFEGIDGIREVLEDSLYSKGEILSYADVESIEKHISELNQWYVAEREKDKIQKRGLVLDTPFNRKFLSDYHTTVTNTRLLPIKTDPFATIMQIYNDKISYITLGETCIGVIITNPHLADMHRKLFEFTWSKANPL